MRSNHTAILHHITCRCRRGSRGEDAASRGGCEVDEEMDSCSGTADDELRDLESGERTLESIRDLNVESGKGVVCVLFQVLANWIGCKDVESEWVATISVWMRELKTQNSQMGGDMKRIPAHMQIIAPE